MISFQRATCFAFSFVLLFLFCTQNPLDTRGGEDPVDEQPVVLSSRSFHVTGILLSRDNKPITGARARLTKTGLSAITDANGVYKIEGNATVALSKRAVNDGSAVTDTLVVVVANEKGSGDSSEVVKEIVTSGIIFELPETYIVQREVRGYLDPHDAKQISRIEAVLYDNAVPDVRKFINLWHDTLNKAFHSFAYFSSATNKQYTLVVNLYDTLDRFIGRSPNFTFPDYAGNIVFANPFRFNNATPTIETINYPKHIFAGDSLQVEIMVSDSFGGKIVSCKVDVGNTGNKVTLTGLAKRMVNGNLVDVFTGKIATVMPDSDSLKSTVYVNDDDSNSTSKQFTFGVTKVSIEMDVKLIDSKDSIVIPGSTYNDEYYQTYGYYGFSTGYRHIFSIKPDTAIPTSRVIRWNINDTGIVENDTILITPENSNLLDSRLNLKAECLVNGIVVAIDSALYFRKAPRNIDSMPIPKDTTSPVPQDTIISCNDSDKIQSNYSGPLTLYFGVTGL